MTGEHVKQVNMRFNSIGTNGHQVILSTGYLRDTVNFINSCVDVFTALELADPKVPAEEVEWREFLRTGGGGWVVRAAINCTGFVAVFLKNKREQCRSLRRNAGMLIVKQLADGTDVGEERNFLAKMERERG